MWVLAFPITSVFMILFLGLRTKKDCQKNFPEIILPEDQYFKKIHKKKANECLTLPLRHSIAFQKKDGTVHRKSIGCTGRDQCAHTASLRPDRFAPAGRTIGIELPVL